MKKIEVKTKAKFKLTVEELEKLMSTYILPNYPYIEYKIEKSNTSDSLYLTFQTDAQIRSIRISDHKIDIPIPTLIVTKNSKKALIVRYITNQLEILQQSSLRTRLDNITTSLSNN